MLSTELMRAFKPFPNPEEQALSYSGAFLTMNIAAVRSDEPEPEGSLPVTVRLNLWPIRDTNGSELVYPEGTIDKAVRQVLSIVGGNYRFRAEVPQDGKSAVLHLVLQRTAHARAKSWTDMVSLFAPRSEEDESSLCKCMGFRSLVS
jgi:hypothetical protein